MWTYVNVPFPPWPQREPCPSTESDSEQKAIIAQWSRLQAGEVEGCLTRWLQQQWQLREPRGKGRRGPLRRVGQCWIPPTHPWRKADPAGVCSRRATLELIV